MSDKTDKGAASSVAQGLQSVMAVIGENYDPAVNGAVDKAGAPDGAKRQQFKA